MEMQDLHEERLLSIRTEELEDMDEVHFHEKILRR